MAKQEDELKLGHRRSGLSSYSQIQQTHLDDDEDGEFSIGPGSESSSFWQANYQNNNRGSFLCEKPSEGLSLSLSSDDPSTLGVQSFELRHTHHQNQVQVQEEVEAHHYEFENILKSSKYLFPCKELLNEFCCLKIQRVNQDKNKYKEGNEDESGSSSISRQHQQSLFGLHLMEPHMRKIKLIALLDELNTKYKLYKDQIVSTARQFESAAGTGSSYAYTSSASKAMSRHFRCLRDALVGQIKAAAAAASGVDGGETTPRLKALDLAIRQRRALQEEMGTTASQPWRPQRGLPEKSVSVLRAWLFDHFLHPYPCDADKHILSRQTGLSRSQVSNWFINARVRLWKPMVEEMYLEERKEDDAILALMNSQTMLLQEDQKPTVDQTLDFGSLSAIISGATTNPSGHHDGFSGPTSLDFSLYNNHINEGNLGVSSVSLTLGLQRDGQPAGSDLYTRGGMEDFNYSLVDGDNETDEAHNLPYNKNLQLATHLLHDFAS